MRFKKFVLCMLIGVLIGNVSNISASAAEEATVNQEQENITEQINTIEQDSITKQESTTGQESTSEQESIAKQENVSDLVNTTKQESTTEKEATIEKETTKENETTVEEETTIEKETSTKEVSIDKDNEETKKAVKKVTNKYTKAELRLLSTLIYCEAQGESYNGKLAVGIVVMNRLRSNRYSDTLKGVIYQKYQFSPVTNGTLKKALAEYDKGNFTSSAEKACIKAAKAALNGTKSITVKGEKKSFSKYLSFSGRLKGYKYKLENHQFK
jgi:N-acetylmuramoyl-L-alanine amidase